MTKNKIIKLEGYRVKLLASIEIDKNTERPCFVNLVEYIDIPEWSRSEKLYEVYYSEKGEGHYNHQTFDGLTTALTSFKEEVLRGI